jgi:LysR family transcriptional activator of glutamate synthase operon
MDIHQLRVFHAAANSGSFTRASEQMRISQSTISQHVKQLETELGCNLFLRIGKRVLLTEAGQMLMEYCEKIFHDLKNAEMSIRALSGMQKGRLRFGSGATTLIYQLPPVLESYSARYPNIELVIATDTTDALVREVRAHRLDLGLVMMPVNDPDLEITPLCAEEILFALPARHPLAQKRTLSATDVEKLSFILYERKTVMRAMIDRYFDQLNVQPRISMVMENIEAIKSLVSTGLGASLLPQHAVSKNDRPDRIRMMRVQHQPLYRHLSMITLRSDFIPQAVRELSRMIVQEIGTRTAAEHK